MSAAENPTVTTDELDSAPLRANTPAQVGDAAKMIGGKVDAQKVTICHVMLTVSNAEPRLVVAPAL
jgi:hypothetical protein